MALNDPIAAEPRRWKPTDEVRNFYMMCRTFSTVCPHQPVKEIIDDRTAEWVLASDYDALDRAHALARFANQHCEKENTELLAQLADMKERAGKLEAIIEQSMEDLVRNDAPFSAELIRKSYEAATTPSPEGRKPDDILPAL